MQGNVPSLARPGQDRTVVVPNGPGGRGPGGGGLSGDGSGGPGGDDKPTSDLNVNKVVAGAGAAIVTAILGSFLGAVGTILGAALGSIVTTVATTFFQRSIEHTRTRVTSTGARIKERRTKGPDGRAVWQRAAAQDAGTGLAGPDGQETVLLDASAAGTRPPGRGRRIRMTRTQVVWSVVGTVLAFALAMFLVTGIEWIKGGTITGGGSGTSVGNVVSGSPTQQTRQDDTPRQSRPTGASANPTGGAESTSSSSTENPTSTSDGGDGSTTGSNPLQDGLDRVLPSPQPESGRLQSGPTGESGSGGGAANTG